MKTRKDASCKRGYCLAVSLASFMMSVASTTKGGTEGEWIKKRKERMKTGLQAVRKIAVLLRASVAGLSFKAMEIELCKKQPPVGIVIGM